MAKKSQVRFATPRDHDHVASALRHHLKHRTTETAPEVAAAVLQSVPKHAGRLFRVDDLYHEVQGHGSHDLNDVLDHMFKMSGELRQPPERVGDVSRRLHATSFASRVRGYQNGDLAEDLIEAARAGDLDTALEEALRLVQPGSAGWTDRSFGAVERQQEIRRHVRAQGQASKRGTTPLHMTQRDWLRGSLRKLGEE